MNKKVITILIIFLFIELVWAAVYLTKKTPQEKQPISQTEPTNQQNPPTLSFSPSTSSPTLDQPFQIAILIDTKEKSITAADIIISYDPTILQIDETGIAVTNAFPSYPLIKVDSQEGIISITGTTQDPKDSPLEGRKEFVTLTFTPIKQGPTQLSFIFEKDSTTDSNLIEPTQIKDILEKVENGSYTVN